MPTDNYFRGELQIGVNNIADASSAATKILTVSSGGLDIVGTVSASADTDIVATFGRAKIGSMGHIDYAGFSHIDNVGQNSYALLQYTDGNTFLNAKTGKDLHFRVNNADLMRLVGSTGNFGINTTSPSEKLDVVGNIVATGTITPSSDDRIKFGETTIENALETIKKINPVSYRKATELNIPDSPELKVELGVVAQELYNTVPELRHMLIFDKTMERNFVDGNLEGNCVEDIYGYRLISKSPMEASAELKNDEELYEEVPTELKNDEEVPTELKTDEELYEEVPTIVSLNYNSFHALSIKAIQELLDKVEKLETRIIELENK